MSSLFSSDNIKTPYWLSIKDNGKNTSSTNSTPVESKPANSTTNTNGTNPYKQPTTNLKKGSKGEGVKWLQWELNEAGYMIDIDGIFGQDTFNAVKKFQKSCKITVDGIVGKDTKKHLKSN